MKLLADLFCSVVLVSSVWKTQYKTAESKAGKYPRSTFSPFNCCLRVVF